MSCSLHFNISHFPFERRHASFRQRATKIVNSFVLLLEPFPSFKSRLKAGDVNCQMHLGAMNENRSVWELLRGSDVVMLHFVKR